MTEKRKYKDRREYIIKAVQQRREKVRLMAIDYKGGSCRLCGYDRCTQALELHHLDPTKKDFGISNKGYTRSWEKVKEEADKCILLCANCHREIHAGILQLPQVTVVEQLGEFREPYPDNQVDHRNGNPERSLSKGPVKLSQRRQERAETRDCGVQPIISHQRPATFPLNGKVDEIVRPYVKA